MKITILNGSPRKGGNTETMVNEFVRGASEAGHETEIITVGNMNIRGCLGCQYCFSHDGQCVQKDDMQIVLDSIDQTDMVVFASPIYWFDMTAQLKAAIDRMYARAKVGIHFNKAALLLDSGSDHVFDAAIAQYKMTCGYLKWEDKGIIAIPGMTDKDSMKTNPALAEAYNLGKSL